MTNRHLRAVTQRLSLRKPQADSLEILAEVLERVTLAKGADSVGCSCRRARAMP